jgi:hypothetical protein
VRYQRGSGIPKFFPGQAAPGHQDGGAVRALFGPALESVEERHRINFTGPARG